MTIFDILGFILLGISALVILLKLFRVLDWSWATALFPLLLSLIYQIMVAVVAGIGNYMGYMRGLSGRLLGQ
jgi:hypothetical protein